MARPQDLVKSLVRRVGFDLRRAPDPSLPFLHDLEVDGRPMRFWITNMWAKSWWHIPSLQMDAEMRAMKRFCAPGAVVLDVGAHHGIQAISCALWVGPQGRVHAFEMNAENALVLHANVAANHLQNCEPVHAAVSDSSGMLSASGETVDKGGANSIRAFALDDYCREGGIGRVDVLKIDIEGFEAHALAGAREILKTAPHLSIELHVDDLGRYGRTPADVLSLLDLTRYEARTYSMRPDWETAHAWRSQDDLPNHGIVNLFLESKERAVRLG